MRLVDYVIGIFGLCLLNTSGYVSFVVIVTCGYITIPASGT